MENACSDSLILKIYDQKDDLKITAFPNPFESELTIVSDIPFEKCLIYDAVGRIVFQKVKNSNSLSVNTSRWNSGVYFVLINTADNRQTSVKIIRK